MDYLGQFAIVHLILHVICICIAYWALNSVRLDQFFKKGYALQVQICMIFVAIMLGIAFGMLWFFKKKGWLDMFK